MSSHLRLFNNQGEKIMQRTLNRESSNENIKASADFSLQRIANDDLRVRIINDQQNRVQFDVEFVT